MSCLRVIGRFVSEFARFILFFASIIFLLSSSLLLVFTFQSRKDFSYVQMDNINTVLTVVVGLSAYLIVLAIAGVFASFFSNKSTIKLLAFMTTLNVIVGIFVLVNASPKLDSVHADLQARLADFQSKYNWKHEATTDEAVKNATRAWDTIQADLHCCGLRGPSDWHEQKPSVESTKLADVFLPISCCQNYSATKSKNASASEPSPPLYCDSSKSEIWTKGCVGEMEVTFALIVDMVIFVVSFSLVVGLLAVVVLCCRPDEPMPRSYISGSFH